MSFIAWFISGLSLVYLWFFRDLLMKNCECPEEGTRNVVAECLGKLALINPTELLPRLKSYLAQPSAHIRSTVITAVKFTISDQVRTLPNELLPCLKRSIVQSPLSKSFSKFVIKLLLKVHLKCPIL